MRYLCAVNGPVEKALRHVWERACGEARSSVPPVTLNFHPDTLVAGTTTIQLLAQEGVYRSQFETGTSNGGLTARPGGERWAWESRIFGGAYDEADPVLRPKYGALNHRLDSVGGSRRFGSCHLRLRPHVLARATFCYPDSHLQPEHFGIADRLALIDLAEQNRLGLDQELDNYIEAHVHGVLRIKEDVEAVVLDPCYRGTAVEDAAHALDCLIEWHGGFRLSIDRLADCRDFRGSMAADAIATIVDHGFVTPALIGAARDRLLDYRTAKLVWHCVAKFGRQ